MPTMTFSRNDFFSLLGTLVSQEKLALLLSCVKGELESFGDELVIQFNDTNLPWVWSVEGCTAVLRGLLGVESGIPVVNIKKGSSMIIADTVPGRPFIAGFLASGNISEELLKQLLQFQEKFCDSFGRKRHKVAVGVYPAGKISFPVRYTLAEPSLEFTPLDGQKQPLSRILQFHPKGKEYAHLLDSWKKLPDDVCNEVSTCWC